MDKIIRRFIINIKIVKINQIILINVYAIIKTKHA